MMKALIHHDLPEVLARAARRSMSGRVSQRSPAIRDIMLGGAGDGCARSTGSAGKMLGIG